MRCAVWPRRSAAQKLTRSAGMRKEGPSHDDASKTVPASALHVGNAHICCLARLACMSRKGRIEKTFFYRKEVFNKYKEKRKWRTYLNCHSRWWSTGYCTLRTSQAENITCTQYRASRDGRCPMKFLKNGSGHTARLSLHPRVQTAPSAS